jgi:hypothetical protein
MRLTGKTLMVNIENDITLENETISMTVIHQAFITEIDNRIDVDIELIDYDNVIFLGKETNFSKLNESLKSFDINLRSIIEDKCEQMFNDDTIEHLKTLYIK